MVVALAVLMATPIAEAKTVSVSWYSQGKRTACGQKFRPLGISVAHKHLKCGTKVRLTFRHRSVIAVVNDRGPFIRSREYDLSLGAANALGITKMGVARIDAVVIGD